MQKYAIGGTLIVLFGAGGIAAWWMLDGNDPNGGTTSQEFRNSGDIILNYCLESLVSVSLEYSHGKTGENRGSRAGASRDPTRESPHADVLLR